MIKWIIHILQRTVAPHLISPIDHENMQADYLRIMRELATAEQTARQRESHVEDLRRANEALHRNLETANREIVRRERSRVEDLMAMDVPPIPRSGVGVEFYRTLGTASAERLAQEIAQREARLRTNRQQRAMGLPIDPYTVRSQPRDQQRFTGPEPEDL